MKTDVGIVKRVSGNRSAENYFSGGMAMQHCSKHHTTIINAQENVPTFRFGRVLLQR